MLRRDILDNSHISENENLEAVKAEKRELCILVTEDDKHGTDIALMSDFFEVYVQQLSYEIIENAPLEVVTEMPFADLSILNEVIDGTKKLIAGEYSLLPDFDSLPNDIKTKLKKGIYTIGESKQVDGNSRAVILDEEGVRIKDITLKRVKNSVQMADNIRSISNQMQMKQISAKLDGVVEYQEYQLLRDRDRDIVAPFLMARNYILEAQESADKQYQIEKLSKAADKLKEALTSVYTDMNTTANQLAKLTDRIFVTNKKQRDTYMRYLAGDLQMATKFVGVQMHVLEYLGDRTAATLALENYQHAMRDFTTKIISKSGCSAAGIMQNNYPYTEKNKDFWYSFSNDIRPLTTMNVREALDSELFVVSLEEVDNDEQ